MTTNDQDTSIKRDSAPVKFPPPLVYIVSIVLGVMLQKYVYSIQMVRIFHIQTIFAILAIAMGVILLIFSLRLFKLSGQRPEPWTSTPEIIARSVYRISRNPMYLGMSLLQMGIAAAVVNLWMLVLVIPSMVSIYWIAIRHEEAYLEKKFGHSYLQYKNSVRRWI